ncbi:MAG: hypothetical protein IT365_18790 [Candidatus Hydrogenedentes bacterium]|nr:hypothetical protein [Candidatus Hydrogenedentota bacterium]
MAKNPAPWGFRKEGDAAKMRAADYADRQVDHLNEALCCRAWQARQYQNAVLLLLCVPLRTPRFCV